MMRSPNTGARVFQPAKLINFAGWKTRAPLLRRAAHALVYAVLALMPFTWAFKGLALSDVALGLAAGLWVVALVLDWKESASALRGLARYWPMGLYVLWTLVAACFAESPKLALVKVFQTVEYFVVAVVLLHDYFSAFSLQPSAFSLRLRNACGVVLAVFTACLAVAGWQYFTGLEDEESFGVRGFFKHRNIFGGYAALLAPVCFGVLCVSRNWMLKIGLGLVVVLSLLTVLNGAAYAAIVLAVAGLAALRGKGWFLATCAALAFFQVGLERGKDLGWPLRYNVRAHLESVEIYENDGRPALRYPEWQAAALLMAEHTLVGVGPGKNYQRKIGPYFLVAERPARDRTASEDDAQIENQYLLLGATLGFPGLLAFLAMMLSSVRAATRAAWRMDGADWQRGLACGLIAGLLAFGAVLVWNSLLVRGTGLVFAAMLAACHALDARTDVERKGIS